MKKLVFLTIITVLSLFTTICSAKPQIKFNILGIDNSELKNEVVAQLQSVRNEISVCDKKAIEEFYRQVPQQINATLKLYGYFNSKVVNNVPKHKNNHWDNTFIVTLGPAMKIVAVDLVVLGEGKNDKKIQRHLRKFPLHVGDVFVVSHYNDAKRFLFDLVGNYGYATAVLIAKEVRIDLQHNTAEIVLHLDTGPRYYFGDTTFSTTVLARKFFASFLPYQPGDIYSSRKLYIFQESLSNSNFFQTVTVKPQIKTQNKESLSRQIPVKVTVIPLKAKQYNFGLGFGTDSGPRGSLGMERRYLTTTGDSFKALLRLSAVQNNLEAHYLIPGKHPSSDLYDISFIGETLDVDNGKSQGGQIGISYTTALKKWNQTIKLRLQQEHYQLTDKPYQNSTLLIPSINWSYSKSDNLVKPDRGYTINVNMQGASKYFLAKNDFFQTRIDAKYIRTFIEKVQVLLRATIGFTAVNDINNLPLSLQYYTGGTHSVRGFSYESIGPGRNLTVGSIELRQRIFGDWYLATFFDAGNANDSFLRKYSQGGGIGVVLRTSVGVFELTYAKAFSLPGSPAMVQFSLGPDL